jgi:hypothetical protein
MPISRGAGWSWGARSRDRAWCIGVGRGGYVGLEGWSSASSKRKDVELGAISGKEHDVVPPEHLVGAGLDGAGNEMERGENVGNPVNGVGESSRI